MYREIVSIWSFNPWKCLSHYPSTCPSHQAAGM